MIITEKTSEFDKWIRKLKDIRAKSKILFRIQKLETDEHFGDCKPVGDGISEMRINYAKGYRVYYKEKESKEGDFAKSFGFFDSVSDHMSTTHD